MKVNRILPVIVSLVMAGGVLAGCAHKHTYEEKWTPAEDGSGHYHVATCHPDEHDELKDHVYDDDKDTTCNDCGYVRTVEQGTPDPTPDPDPKPSGDTSTPLPADKKIYLVGDSTVCDYEKTASLDNAFLPRYGYGTQFAEYLNVTSDQIVNLALSGKSSKSFIIESNYTTLKNSIAEGDYLIIGFGHNDEKAEDTARHTSPVGDHTVEGSFQKTLYDNYVKLAKDKNATPILCTPIVRYSDSNSYTGDKIHVTVEGDYAAAIKALGAATETTVIDLTTITKEIYTENNEAAKYFHCHTTYEGDPVATLTGNEVPSGKDNTHLNKYGAKRVAYEFARALPASCSLKSHVKDGITAPTYDKDFKSAIRMDYVKAAYSAPALGSSIAELATTTPSVWYKSAFGDIGGNDKVSKFNISCANNKFSVGSPQENVNGTNKVYGKFAAAGDGFGTAFMQIDAKKDFKASATIKVTATEGTNNQSGFGMMLRDDMYIDLGKDFKPQTNFIAVGNFNGNAVFKRNETTLSGDTSTAVTVDKTKTYQVSIERVGTSIKVTFSDGTKNFDKSYQDIKFDSVDENYMYLCLFANRGYVTEFSNVQFEITGDSQGA